MANYSLKAELIGFDDKPIVKTYEEITQEELLAGKKPEAKEYWTLRESLIAALNATDGQPAGDDLLKRYDYLMRIKRSKDTIALSSEDVTFLKDISKKSLVNVVILGETHRLLETPVIAAE